MNKIIFLIIIVIVIIILFKKKQYEAFGVNDYSLLTANPIIINEIQGRGLYRTVGIKYNLKMDKQGRIEKITYDPPLPESGETICRKVQCPSWYDEVVCWKCY